MPNDKKFLVKNGLTTQNISFADNVTLTTSTNTISVSMLSSDTLSFSGGGGGVREAWPVSYTTGAGGAGGRGEIYVLELG